MNKWWWNWFNYHIFSDHCKFKYVTLNLWGVGGLAKRSLVGWFTASRRHCTVGVGKTVASSEHRWCSVYWSLYVVVSWTVHTKTVGCSLLTSSLALQPWKWITMILYCLLRKWKVVMPYGIWQVLIKRTRCSKEQLDRNWWRYFVMRISGRPVLTPITHQKMTSTIANS